MKYVLTALPVMACIASLTMGWTDEPTGTPSKSAPTAAAAPAVEPLPLPAARRQAEVLHSAMHATLQVVHHEYYQNDKGLRLPAAVLKDVFEEIEQDQHIKLRWLAVEGKAMNSDHEARDEFETEAVKVLKSGQSAYERAEKGVYRRAGAITLTNHCLKCHVPNRRSLEDRTAGLIISIPIKPQ